MCLPEPAQRKQSAIGTTPTKERYTQMFCRSGKGRRAPRACTAAADGTAASAAHCLRPRDRRAQVSAVGPTFPSGTFGTAAVQQKLAAATHERGCCPHSALTTRASCHAPPSRKPHSLNGLAIEPKRAAGSTQRRDLHALCSTTEPMTKQFPAVQAWQPLLLHLQLSKAMTGCAAAAAAAAATAAAAECMPCTSMHTRAAPSPRAALRCRQRHPQDHSTR